MRPPLKWLLLLLAVGLPLAPGWPGAVGVPPALAQERKIEPQKTGTLKPLKETPSSKAALLQALLKQNSVDQPVLLEQTGTLAEGDATLDDGSLYDEYFFQGEAGQIVKITLDSTAFDTYLILEDASGERIAVNDDGSNGSNAEIVIQLPKAGQYRVLANAYSETGRGAYRLTITPANAEDLQLANLQNEADRLLAEGSDLDAHSQFPEALSRYENALALYRQLHNRYGEAQTLNNIGIVNASLGNYPAALDSYQQSLVITRQIGEAYGASATLRAIEAKTLNNIGGVNASLGNYPTALEYYQQSLVITREIGDRATEALTLTNIGNVNGSLGNYPTALEYYQQSLMITREIGEASGASAALRATAALTLNNIGVVNQYLGNYPAALDYYGQSLVITQQIGDRATTALTLNNIGNVNQYLGNYPTALEYYQQSLVITREIGDRATEALTLNSIGVVNQYLGNYPAALEYYQQSLVITREIGDRATAALTLTNIGNVNQSLGNYPTALEYYQQSLVITREIGNRATEALTLNSIGGVNQYLGNYPAALDSYQQSLVITQQIGDRATAAQTLNNIGIVNQSLGNYPTALEYYQQSLVITRQIGDRASEAQTLNNIGIVNQYLGNYPVALDSYEQSLVTTRQIGDRATEAKTLNNIGIVNDLLGNYPEALDYYAQSLVITRQIGDRATAAATLNNIGLVNKSLGNYPAALDSYQQSLVITREIGDRATEAQTLNNIGFVNDLLGNYPAALDSYQQSLVITRQIGDRATEAATLNNIGLVNKSLGNYPAALDSYQQSLVITRQIGNRAGEAQTLNNIGSLYQAQGQPELAIVFFKNGVNTYEAIRQSNRALAQSLQDSYTATVEDDYRALADLLIDRGRLAEAQRVLELLKVQELQDFTRSAELAETQGTIPLIALEREILAEFDGTLLDLAKALYDCEQTRCSQLSSLRDQLDAQTLAFNSEVATFRKALQEQLAKDPGILSADSLSKTAREVVTAQDGFGTVLVYPLVLKDRVRILIAVRAGENGVAFRAVETSVNQEQLWQTVNEFRELLETPNSDLESVQAKAAELYDWLIAPLEQELSAQEIDHLVFALDRSTRYIPMGALFDNRSQQYLVEKYAVSTILGADLTDMSDLLSPDIQSNAVLGLGLSMPVEGFNALPNVVDEVNAIVQTTAPDDPGIYPGRTLFDDDFTYEALRDALAGNRILHIATHASFELGLPQNSFLLGSEGRITIDRIQLLNNYGLDDINLVVLSACETARGGPDDNGIEVPGISYYFLGGGAKAVMASLWLVDDSSTSLLMQQFYRQLATGEVTKAEALRRAQRAFIQNDAVVVAAWRRGGFVNAEVTAEPAGLNHPYYWAPFILIGNGL